MAGIRSWTGEVTAFVVVRIERSSRFFIRFPLGSFQRSQIPANANNSPSLTSKQRLFGFSCLHPLVKAVRGDQASAGFQRVAEREFGAAVSDRALIMLAAAAESFDTPE
jgi:hypothetical protein